MTLRPGCKQERGTAESVAASARKLPTPIHPYSLARCTTSTGKFYMRRDPWQDMSDFGWGWRRTEGWRVSRYFELTEMEEMRRWCQQYTAKHPGNTIHPEEAEALAHATA